jgi:hypothetical protein
VLFFGGYRLGKAEGKKGSTTPGNDFYSREPMVGSHGSDTGLWRLTSEVTDGVACSWERRGHCRWAWLRGLKAGWWGWSNSFKLLNFSLRVGLCKLTKLSFLNSKIYQALWGGRINKKEQLSIWA